MAEEISIYLLEIDIDFPNKKLSELTFSKGKFEYFLMKILSQMTL